MTAIMQELVDWGVADWTPDIIEEIRRDTAPRRSWDTATPKQRWWYYRRLARNIAREDLGCVDYYGFPNFTGAAEVDWADVALDALLSPPKARRWMHWAMQRVPRLDRASPYNAVSESLVLWRDCGAPMAADCSTRSWWYVLAHLAEELGPSRLRGRRWEQVMHLVHRLHRRAWPPLYEEAMAQLRWLWEQPWTVLRHLHQLGHACLVALLGLRPCGGRERVWAEIQRFERLPRRQLEAARIPARYWLTGLPSEWIPSWLRSHFTMWEHIIGEEDHLSERLDQAVHQSATLLGLDGWIPTLDAAVELLRAGVERALATPSVTTHDHVQAVVAVHVDAGGPAFGAAVDRLLVEALRAVGRATDFGGRGYTRSPLMEAQLRASRTTGSLELRHEERGAMLEVMV